VAVWLLNLVAGGMLAVLAMCRPDQIAWRFVRLIGVLSLAMLAGAGGWMVYTQGWQRGTGPAIAQWLTILAAISAALLIGLAGWAERRRGLFVAMTVTGAAAALAAGFVWAQSLELIGQPSAGRWLGVAVGQVLGALLMGCVTTAWLLGHAYLTATRMTIAPLRRLARILIAAVALRCAFAAASLATAWLATGDDAIAPRLLQSWMVLCLRGGLGLVLPAVFAYMVYDCVRLRSTQSATGILYFASLFVYVGELSSQHLLSEVGWPV
jgi:hypothetical protein